MKRPAVIFLICIYAFATVGFSLKEFNCCGMLKSISVTLSTNGKDKCGKGDSDKQGCCKSKFQYFKVKDNHITADHISSPAKHFIILHHQLLSFQDANFALLKSTASYKSNAPPLHTGTPLYISIRVFRI